MQNGWGPGAGPGTERRRLRLSEQEWTQPRVSGFTASLLQPTARGWGWGEEEGEGGGGKEGSLVR